MTFHGALPALDATGVPATLSPAIIGGLLRRDLGFGGIAITDAMDMRGVLDRFGGVEATQRAVAAGADVLIQPEDVAATINAIVAGIQAGRYSADRVTEAARRILSAKRRLRAGEERFDPERVRSAVGSPAHRALADTIATRSLTLVRDVHQGVPLRAGARVTSVTVARRPDLTAGATFDAALRAAGMRVRSVFIDADAATPDAFARARAAADSGDAIVIGSYVATRWDAATIQQSAGFVDFVQALAAARPRDVSVIAFGNPYLLQQIADVPAYLVAWGGGAASQAAAARAMAGRGAITGRLPISIPPLAARGTGVMRGAAR
jgi:beta-N-acetylhexosaminidase